MHWKARGIRRAGLLLDLLKQHPDHPQANKCSSNCNRRFRSHHYGFGVGCRQQIDEHLVKLFRIEVDLHFNAAGPQPLVSLARVQLKVFP